MKQRIINFVKEHGGKVTEYDFRRESPWVMSWELTIEFLDDDLLCFYMEYDTCNQTLDEVFEEFKDEFLTEVYSNERD